MESILASIGKSLAGPATPNVILFFGAALVAQLLNGIQKWTRRETESPLSWFTTNAKATVAAVVANVGAVVAGVQLLPIETLSGWASVFAGAMCGYAIDNAVNKGARAQWTDEQRALTAAQKAP